MKLKKCPRCTQEKPQSEFYRRRDKSGSSSYCKTCSKDEVIIRQRANKQAAVDFLGGACRHCGLVSDPAVYDFHHLDPSQKDFSISQAKGWSLENLIPELEKCALLCSNCHRLEHLRLRGKPLPPVEAPSAPCLCVCGKPKTRGAATCYECKPKSTKIIWPEIEEMRQLVWQEPLIRLASKLGVSDVAVKKHCVAHGIQLPNMGHWVNKKPVAPRNKFNDPS